MENVNHTIHKTVRLRPGKQQASSLKYASLVEVIRELIEKEFTGHLKINFSQGVIGRIEKFEEILRGNPAND